MKIAIVGSRTFDDYNKLVNELTPLKEQITEVISGGAKGADTLAEKWAKDNNIKSTVYHADWDRWGKSAGFRRNIDIVNTSDLVVAFHDGISKGTAHTIKIARDLGKTVKVYGF